MLKYSLAGLFLAVLAASLACAAIVNGTFLWSQAMVTVTVLALLLFTVVAPYRSGSRRAFAIGFCAAGWIYFLIAFTSLVNARGSLLTETAAQKLYQAIHGKNQAAYSIVYRSPGPTPGQVIQTLQVVPTAPVPQPTPSPPQPNVIRTAYATTAAFAPVPATNIVDFNAFKQTCHAIWTILIACMCGIVAQIVYSRSQRASAILSADEATST